MPPKQPRKQLSLPQDLHALLTKEARAHNRTLIGHLKYLLTRNN